MINDKLKEFRIQNGYTQKDMALKLNITQACYNRYEKGLREPSISTIKKLCVLFNCTTDELLEMDTPGDRSKIQISNSFNNSRNVKVKIK